MSRPTARRSTALRVEDLESREVYAVAAPTSVPVDGNGLAWVAAKANPVYAPQGVVSLYSSVANSRYTIRQVANPGFIQVDAVVNGRLTSIQYRNVSEVRFYGSSGADVFENLTTTTCKVYGNAGNDTLIGGQGNDFIDGGSGSDRVYGRGGNDRLFGGIDVDTIYGGTGNDSLAGGAGTSSAAGDKVADVLFGEEGTDYFLFDAVPGKPGGPAVNVDAPRDFSSAQRDAVVNWI